MASGPASEPAVILSAAVSFLVFLCYFAYVLFSVPRHWGVPYKNRLNRHISTSRRGLLVEVFNALFSLATCVLFIIETYPVGSNYDFIVLSFSLEMIFNGFFLWNFLLHFYLAADKLTHLVSLQALVDILTVFPSYVILFVNDGWRTSSGGVADVYLALKITRVIRVARLLVTISFFVQGPSLAFDNSRQIHVLRSQLIRWSLKTVVVIFTLSGLMNFLVEVQDADWGTGYGSMPFHEALYFVVVSFSTVGYGDISPSTVVSRLIITGLILTLFFCVPVLTNALLNITRLTPKHGGRLSKSWGTGHIVVGCDSGCIRVVSVLLRDLLSADSMAYHHAHVVLVVPQEPTLAWEALLCLQPSFAVTYLNGDLSSAEDLRRARVADARACIVLSDRLAPDPEAQDKVALIRALCANQASPLGASVLCLVTHTRSKRRLVRLGMPAASVVCYDDVMEGLVTNACLSPGFSTLWANMLSCMPEADFLIKARQTKEVVSTSSESTLLFETEMEYLRSLRRVMMRFNLTEFAGEFVGDVAIELHEKCGCTLFALVCTACSGGHKDGKVCGGGQRGRTCTRVHPDYGTVVQGGDIGVFIGVSHTAADLLARYCATRIPSGKRAVASSSASKPTAEALVGHNNPSGGGGGGDNNRQRTVWSEVHKGSDGGGGGGSGDGAPTISPLGQRLVGTPPGVVLVIAQSLSFALGVVLSLCEADTDFNFDAPAGDGSGDGSGGGGGGKSQQLTAAVSVLCSPSWWDPAVDEPAERELAERFPSVRVIKRETECTCLAEIGADLADLVCVVSSRPEDDPAAAAARLGGADDEIGHGVGDQSGRGQGSDVWAMGVVVDVLGLVAESTRVVVRFDDSTSAEQHQVISAHVRRRADAEEARGEGEGERGWRAEGGGGRGGGGGGKEEKGDREDEEKEQLGEGLGSRVGVSSTAAPTKQRGLDAAQRRSVDALVEGSFRDGVEVRGGEGGVYFDDARGVVHEGFDDYFATMSGYASGDVVVGNAAELLLLQTMLASDIQSLMNDVFHLISRVSIEALWPGHHPSDAQGTATGKTSGNNSSSSAGAGAGRARPKTYGEAYRTLLEDRDLLAMGIHRPPARRRGDTTSRRCPGGSRYVAINCPTASFALRDGDCFFVLRRPGEVVVKEAASPDAVAPKTAAFDASAPAAAAPSGVAPIAAAGGGVPAATASASAAAGEGAG